MKPSSTSGRSRATRTCVGCGKLAAHTRRSPEGSICLKCWRNDVRFHEQCLRCGRMRDPAVRLPAGVLCRSCRPLPRRLCVQCGNSAPVGEITDAGPVCRDCYAKQDILCGSCGRVGRVYRRATVTRPAGCVTCRPNQQVTCARCGEHRRGAHRGGTEPLCYSCWPKRQNPCAECGALARTAARWPLGDVCPRCYIRIRRDPATCARCGNLRALIARERTGARVCGPCVGVATAFGCRQCGTDCITIADRLCGRCVLNRRRDELFTGLQQTMADQLAPLRQAVTDTDQPVWTARWLTGATVATLRKLIAGRALLTHDDLDQLPQDKTVRHLRDVLTHTGVLPERDERLHRLDLWLRELIGNEFPQHARLLDAYGRWAVLHRLRRNHRGKPVTADSAAWARHRIRAAARFLNWLDRRQVNLVEITQADIDTWLVDYGNATAYNIELFIDWLEQRRLLVHKITVPARPRRTTITPLDRTAHHQQLHRCVTDWAPYLQGRIADDHTHRPCPDSFLTC